MCSYPPGCLSQTMRNFTPIYENSLSHCLLYFKVHILRTIFNNHIIALSLPMSIITKYLYSMWCPRVAPFPPKQAQLKVSRTYPHLLEECLLLLMRSYNKKDSRKTIAQGSLQEKNSQLNPSWKRCSAHWEVTGSVLLPVWCNKTSSSSATSWSHMCRRWHSFCTQRGM